MPSNTSIEIPLTDSSRAALAELCQRFRVERLDLFGSGTGKHFDPATSDLDFIVEFSDHTAGYADRYLDFAESLEELFQRPVDLVTARSIRNPIFRHRVESTRQTLYDCRDEKTAA